MNKELRFDAKYLPGLDLLRFLLAMSILITHFSTFSSRFLVVDTMDKSVFPFWGLLHLVYNYGSYAVEVFWMVSGIIFYHFYKTVIAEGTMSLYKFVCLRFSRLYPLHLLTLCSVAALQYVYTKRVGVNYAYANNDALHFVLNLFMINFWNPKFMLSFNGPFWSVSAEIFVYIIFFNFAHNKVLNNSRYTLGLVLVSFIFYMLGILSPFYECILYFFAGCFLAQQVERIRPIHILLCLVSIAIMLIGRRFALPHIHNLYILRTFDCLVKLDIAATVVLIFCRLLAKASEKLTSILRMLGNMTYAVYMIHITLQLIFVLVFFREGFVFFTSKLFFLLYIFSTLFLGYIIFRYFEMPVQHYLRKKLIIKNQV